MFEKAEWSLLNRLKDGLTEFAKGKPDAGKITTNCFDRSIKVSFPDGPPEQTCVSVRGGRMAPHPALVSKLGLSNDQLVAMGGLLAR